MPSVEKRNLFLMCICFLASAIMVYSLNIFHKSQPEKRAEQNKSGSLINIEKPNNPIYNELVQIGKKYNLDLSFTRDVQYIYQKDLYTFESALFCNREKSLDLIFFGDSSIAWGLIPQVIEQMTGLKTGMFALRGMYLNKRTLEVLKRLREYYLKKDGLSIFAFHLWSQEKDPDIFRREDNLSKISGMSSEKFRSFAYQRFASCNGLQADTEYKYSGKIKNLRQILKWHAANIFTRDSLEYQKGKFIRLQKSIREFLYMHLPHKTVIHRWVNRKFNPAWYVDKQSDKNRTESLNSNENLYAVKKSGSIDQIRNMALWLRWDQFSTTIYLEHGFKTSIYSNSPPDMSIPISEHMHINAGALISFPGRSAYMIPFYSGHSFYIKSRSIFERFYKGRLDLIDLGLQHPRHKNFPMDKLEHLLNTGGLYQTIEIAKWINNNYRKK